MNFSCTANDAFLLPKPGNDRTDSYNLLTFCLGRCLTFANGGCASLAGDPSYQIDGDAKLLCDVSMESVLDVH